jgi:hypothetical protein
VYKYSVWIIVIKVKCHITVFTDNRFTNIVTNYKQRYVKTTYKRLQQYVRNHATSNVITNNGDSVKTTSFIKMDFSCCIICLLTWNFLRWKIGKSEDYKYIQSWRNALEKSKRLRIQRLTTQSVIWEWDMAQYEPIFSRRRAKCEAN